MILVSLFRRFNQTLQTAPSYGPGCNLEHVTCLLILQKHTLKLWGIFPELQWLCLQRSLEGQSDAFQTSRTLSAPAIKTRER